MLYFQCYWTCLLPLTPSLMIFYLTEWGMTYRRFRTALLWFKSYLSGRLSRVSIPNLLWSDLEYGLPQGSILGPFMFVIYTLPLGNIIRHHNIDFHLYADDTQLYCSFDPWIPSAWQVAIKKLQLCITDVQNWMTSNKLKGNSTVSRITLFSVISWSWC